MKKNIIMFVVTIIISLFIAFYNPNKNYLGVYKNNIIIEYEKNEECEWNYELENNNLEYDYYKDLNDSEQWNFKIKNNGIESLTFICKNDDNIKYTIYYNFNIKKNKIIWIEGEAHGLLDYPNPK